MTYLVSLLKVLWLRPSKGFQIYMDHAENGYEVWREMALPWMCPYTDDELPEITRWLDRNSWWCDRYLDIINFKTLLVNCWWRNA